MNRNSLPAGLRAALDPEKVTAMLRAVAQEVILPRFRHLEAQDIREKNPGDLVTIADLAAEKALTEALCGHLPDSVVVGEESVAADPALLNLLGEPKPVWVIDPIDGTGNFVRGEDRFAIILALVVDRTTLAGWIHDPVRDLTAWAITGEGCWRKDERVLLRDRPAGGFSGSTSWRDRPRLEKAGHRFRQCSSAAHDYLSLLDGSLDFSFYRRLHPWDHAAGVLMVREAGGVAKLADGADYAPGLPQTGLLCCGGETQWQGLAGVFSP